jgi:hypothetical protein
MKKNLLLIAFLIVTGTESVIAQPEIIVDPGFNTLSNAVEAHPGSTLILTRGSRYVIDRELLLTLPTVIKGEREPAENSPPVVSFYADPSSAAGNSLFAVLASCVFQDVGMMGFTIDEQQIGAVIRVMSPDISIILDGCIIQGASQIMETNGNNGLTIIQRNNIIFNLVRNPWSAWGGIGTAFGGDLTRFQCYNNTFFMCGQFFGNTGAGPDGSERIEHNTYCNTWNETFFPIYNKDFILKNNIFYNTQMRGYAGVRMAENGDTIWPGDYNDWIYDSLCGDVAILPHSADSAGSGPREVVLAHNLKFYDNKVLDFYKANHITPQTFFNITGYQFAEKYGWAIEDNILEEEGNSIDPEFTIGDLPDSTYTFMFQQRIEETDASAQGEGYPYTLGWWPGGATKGTFIWPLPFNFKPNNNAMLNMGDDGYPPGDLNWFGRDVVNAWQGCCAPTPIRAIEKFEIKLKIYPNPSQNNTSLSFNIPRTGIVSVEILNVMGQVMDVLVSKQLCAGNHTLNWNVEDRPSGMYICQLQFNGTVALQKFMVVH